MTAINHPSASLFRCESGDACEFFIHNDEHKKHLENKAKQEINNLKVKHEINNPDNDLSLTSKILIYTAGTGVWSGIGAAANYLSGGNPVAGALFYPITSEVQRGLNFAVSQLSSLVNGDTDENKEKLPSFGRLAKGLTTKAVSVIATNYALNTLGYSVTRTALAVNVIPLVTGCAITAGLIALIPVVDAMAEGINHMHYHKVPCPCPDKTPEIEQAEKFLKEHRHQISTETDLLLQGKIKAVLQAVGFNEDIQKAKEELVLELTQAKKAIAG